MTPPSWWNFPCILLYLPSKLSWKISNFREGVAKPSHGNTSAQCLAWVMSHLMGSVTMRPWHWNRWLWVTKSLVWDQEGYIEPMGCGVLDEHPEAAMLLDQGIQAFTLLISLTVELTYKKSSSTYLWLNQKRWMSLNFFVALQFPQFSCNRCHLAMPDTSNPQVADIVKPGFGLEIATAWSQGLFFTGCNLGEKLDVLIACKY